MGLLFPTNSYLTSDNTSSIVEPILRWILEHSRQETIDLLHKVIRKLGHFLSYALLASLIYRAFRGGRNVWSSGWIIYSVVIAAGYAAHDEYIQTFVPTRTGSGYDWLIDLAGAIFACGIIVLLIRRSRNEAAVI